MTHGSDAYAGVLQSRSRGHALDQAGLGHFDSPMHNTYTGDTAINGGDLRFDAGGTANNSTMRLGATGREQPSATLSLGAPTENNFAARWKRGPSASGTQGTRVLRSLATSGTNTYSGAITLNAGLTLESATGGTLLLQGGSVAFGTNTLTIDTQVDLNGANSCQHAGRGHPQRGPDQFVRHRRFARERRRQHPPHPEHRQHLHRHTSAVAVERERHANPRWHSCDHR